MLSSDEDVDANGLGPTSLAPQDGDVLVTREVRSPVHFTVRQLPALVQLSASTCDDALRIARAFAQQRGLNVWYSENGDYRLLEAYRPQHGIAVHPDVKRPV